jgi:DNA-binding transcriptional MerR regulator/effector-binding domain-containing protein
MIKIGDFSSICQLPVKTLRFYDEVGLLKPVEVDRFTGYRYYAFDQLPRLNRILALKDLGFSLEQIRSLLEKDLPAAEIRGMLRMKQVELEGHIQEELARLKRIEGRLKHIEQEDCMPDYEIVLKKTEPLLVAGVRDLIPSYPEQGHLWEKLETHLQKAGASIKGACLSLYYSDSSEGEIDAEVCEPLARSVPSAGVVNVHELPAVDLAASLIHHGPFSSLDGAYTAIFRWIETNGYLRVGPIREIYLSPPGEAGNPDDPKTVTEIQIPVQKVG